MRQFVKAVLCSVPIVALGCSFAQNTRRNIIASPLFSATEAVDHRRHMQMGREAWAAMAEAYSEYEYSCDYRRGFVEGFADYLDFGGTGDPPPLAPPIYRIAAYETPVGMQMAEDWTCGFRHGAATAKASGLRNLVTVQVFKGPVYGTYMLEGMTPDNSTATTAVSPPKTPVPLPPPAPLPIEPVPPPPTPADDQKFESESK